LFIKIRNSKSPTRSEKWEVTRPPCSAMQSGRGSWTLIFLKLDIFEVFELEKLDIWKI